jgi:hypothetical protein
VLLTAFLDNKRYSNKITIFAFRFNKNYELMSSFAAIRRYYLIYDKLSRSKYPDFNSIMDWLVAYDCNISGRTLQRDIMRMRYDFGIEIAYSSNENGYFIDNVLSIKPDVFLRFLELVATAEMLAGSVRESKETLKYIQFDSRGGLKGIEQLPKIILAIKENRHIKFVHHNFFTGKHRKYELKPYFIKEYLNRWYVIGMPFNSEAFLTFGIDRIESLEVTNKHFTRCDDCPEVFFDHVVGVTWNPPEGEKVVFAIEKPYDNYIKTLPVHSSQRIISEDSLKSVFEIEVVINYELTQRFLMLAADCEVLAPDSLRKTLCESYINALNKYKDEE